MSSMLGLLLAGAVISTAIKVGVLVIGAKVYKARHQRSEGYAVQPSAHLTPAPISDQPRTAEPSHIQKS